METQVEISEYSIEEEHEFLQRTMQAKGAGLVAAIAIWFPCHMAEVVADDDNVRACSLFRVFGPRETEEPLPERVGLVLLASTLAHIWQDEPVQLGSASYCDFEYLVTSELEQVGLPYATTHAAAFPLLRGTVLRRVPEIGSVLEAVAEEIPGHTLLSAANLKLTPEGCSEVVSVATHVAGLLIGARAAA